MQRKSQLVTLFVIVAGLAPAGCHGVLPPPPPPPFAGAEVRVACPPGAAELVARHSRAWQARQQARVRVVAPGAEADLWVLPPAEMPRHAAADALTPLPEALLARGAPFDWAGLLAHYREPLLLWQRVAYAAPLLGEAPVCLYRRDLYEDATHQKEYRTFQQRQDKPVRDLRPPTTWDELATQAEYFSKHRVAGKVVPSLPALPADGRELDRLFYTVAAGYARRAVPAEVPAEREEIFAFHYDLAAGQPRIATPGFVAALAVLQRLQACRPKGAAARPEEAFLNGEAVLCLAEPGLLAKAQQNPALRDRVGVCQVPGAERYFTTRGQEVSMRGGANRVPYLGGAGLLLAVPKAARQGAAALDLLAELAGPQRAMQIALAPEHGGGLTRLDQALRDRWGAFGLDAPRTQALKEAAGWAMYRHGLKGPALCLRTPDEAQAHAALVAALRPALVEGGDAARALQGVRERWEKLAAARGEKHAAEYRISLGLLGQ